MDSIPPELAPLPNQIPPFITTDDELLRYRLCFAVTRMITGRDDVNFTRQLYSSDLPTGNLQAKVNGGERP